MAVLTHHRSERYFGLRSMDPMKDLRGVADLIEEAFADDLDRSGQSALQELRWLSRLKPILWWMIYTNPEHTDFLSGFVWEEESQIVGNITINRTKVSSRRWLISNLAVKRNYRGRGIARSLMDAALELVNEYNGLSISLQVRADNKPARNLYESLGFKEISGNTHLWLRRVPKVEFCPLPGEVILRPRTTSVKDTRHAYNLACVTMPLSAQREWPPRQRQFQLTGSEAIGNFFRGLIGGGPPAYWVVEDGVRFVGMLNIRPGAWRQRHRIELVVHPDWRGTLERPLINRALDYLYPWRSREVSIKHPADHTEAVKTYEQFGFIKKQTLIWMKLALRTDSA